jgi:hypothetical protein
MEQLVAMNNQAVDMFFIAVRKMPADKQNWKPLDEGRSALEQAQEMAVSPDMFLVHLAPGRTPLYSSWEEASQAAGQMDLDACEAACRKLTAEMNDAIMKITPEQAAEKKALPWGAEHTVGEIAGFHYWNAVYHLGQVNYIQTLYGDRDMF